MKKYLLSISLITALTQNLFAYNDFNTFSDKETTKNNNNNIAFKYYQTGISDTLLVFKDEIKKSSLYNSSFTVNNKFVVYIDVTYKSIEEIVFFRAVAQKTNLFDSFLINKNKKNKYVLFGIYENEIDANFSLAKIKEYNIPANKIFVKNETYTYDDLLMENIDKSLGVYNKKIPLKLMLVKERIFVDSYNDYKTNNIDISENSTSFTKNKVKNNKKKNNSEKVSKDYINKRECLIKTIKELRSFALFNNKALKIKYNNKIYQNGDTIFNAKANCSFKITNIYTKNPANLVIQFDDFTNDKLIARLQTYQDNFVSLNSIFYDYDKDIKVELDNNKKEAENNTNVVNNPNDNVKKISTDNKENTDSNKNNIENVKDIQNSKEEIKSNVVEKSGLRKICNFNALNGIRTQLITDSNGKVIRKPILAYYQGKEVEVNVIEKDGEISVSSPNSGQMKIAKEDYQKHCK